MTMVPYPVSVVVEAQIERHDRLTVFLRPILAIPHLILVGPMWGSSKAAGTGLIGAAAYVMAIVSWFTLLTSGQHIDGIRAFALYYLRWRARVFAYLALFSDRYPPFGDGDYGVRLDVAEPAAPRDPASIALRLILAIPHIVLLIFLTLAWFVSTVIAWCTILVTGTYPAGLAPFGIGVLRWTVRVEAYLLLLVDEYPPFSLE